MMKKFDIWKYRDEYLLKRWWGRVLVGFYYKTSPPIARYISRNIILRAFVRWCLKPMVFIAKESTW